MNSIQQRIERYKILYTWKTIENMVPNCGIEVTENPRLGRLCKVPYVQSKGMLGKLRNASFQVTGPTLFNSLPIQIRNLKNCNKEFFKCVLDSYLTLIPDEPKMPGLIPAALTQSAMSTNTLSRQIVRAQREGLTAGWRLPPTAAADSCRGRGL